MDIIAIRKKVAAQFGLELWFDRKTQLWTLMDKTTAQSKDHFYPAPVIRSLTTEQFRSECIDLVASINGH